MSVIQMRPCISALYSIDNIVIGTISFTGKLFQSDINHFKLSVNGDLKDIEFPGNCSSFEASGFDRDRSYKIRLHAYTSTKEFPEYISEEYPIQVSGVVTGLYPTVFVQWEIKKKDTLSPVLAIKWPHTWDKSIEEYIVYLNQWELPVTRISREDFVENICVLIDGVKLDHIYEVEVHANRTENQIECSDRLIVRIPKTTSSLLKDTRGNDLNSSNDEYPISYMIRVSKTEPSARKMNMAKIAEKFMQMSAHDKTILLSEEKEEEISKISLFIASRRGNNHLTNQQKAQARSLLARLDDQIREREYSQTNGYPYS